MVGSLSVNPLNPLYLFAWLNTTLIESRKEACKLLGKSVTLDLRDFGECKTV